MLFVMWHLSLSHNNFLPICFRPRSVQSFRRWEVKVVECQEGKTDYTTREIYRERERTILVASSKFEHIAYNMRPIQRISTLWILCMVTTSGKKRLTSFSLGDIKTLKKIEKFLVFLVWWNKAITCDNWPGKNT